MSARHVTYGGSTAEIWRNCHGWASLIRQVPGRPVGMAAHAGTAQHTVMERLLKDPDAVPHKFEGVKIATEGGDIEIDRGHIAAIDVALEAWEGLLREHEERDDEGELQLFSERFVAGAAEDEGGTIDGLLVRGRRATFADFKFGQVEVDPGGWQNFWYMICARVQMPTLFRGVEEWESVIIQPAWDPAIDRVVVTTAALDRLQEEARAAIAASRAPNPPFVEGEWCRWCAAKLVCPAKTQRLATLAAPNHVMDLGEIETLLLKLRGYDVWRKEAEERLLHELEYGRQLEHFKLVAKRGERRWTNEPAAIALLRAKGVPPSDYLTQPMLHSPAQMEARGLLKRAEITKDIAETYSGGHTIAPMTDKRPAILPPGALKKALMQ